MTRALIVCDGATPSRRWAQESWPERQTLSTTGLSANLQLRVQSLASTVLSRVQARGADLVRIAAYVYGTDQQFSRGGLHDVHGRRWRRQLALCIPVNEPEFWMQEQVRAQLRDVLDFLTEDAWDFEFAPAGPTDRQFTWGLAAAEVLQQPDSVLLFSGGADSLCAAVEAVAERHERPVLISHRAAPNLDARQQELRHALCRRLPEWSFPHLGFWIHRTGAEAKETTQRSRAFLFACLGAAVANELGVDRVLLADNGVVSLNLPINRGVSGAVASRSTHPQFIHRLNQLIETVLPTTVRVTNPFWVRTRTEVLEVLKRADCAELLQETVSCAHSRGKIAAKPQCGYCSQCIDRRFGAIAAGLEEYDLAERYGRDLFVESLPEGEPRTIAESFVRLAQAVREASDDALFMDYPQLMACILPDDPCPDQTGRDLAALIRRHASGVCEVLGLMLRRYSDALARGEVPEDSLLRLVVGSARVAEAVVEGNVFRRDGQDWTVAYAGTTRRVRDRIGMRYIARLLRAAGQEITALALAQAEKVEPTPPWLESDQAWGDADLDAAGMHVAGPADRDAVADQPTVADLQRRAVALRREIQEAEDNLEHQQAAAARDQLDQILEYLAGALGKGGRPRRFTDADERARKAVSRAITLALRAIEPLHPALARHLDKETKRGRVCSYCPDPSVTWLT